MRFLIIIKRFVILGAIAGICSTGKSPHSYDELIDMVVFKRL